MYSKLTSRIKLFQSISVVSDIPVSSITILFETSSARCGSASVSNTFRRMASTAVPLDDTSRVCHQSHVVVTPSRFVSSDTFSSMVDRLHVRLPLSSISRCVVIPEIAKVHFLVGLRPRAIIGMKPLFFYAAKLNKFVFSCKLKESHF